MTRSRRLIRVPEVIQTSAMDCGPAALAALLSGFDLPTNTAHLREVCQTDLDGTSIDTIEQVARACGLDAEQVMLPIDYLLEEDARALPAVAVIALPNGNTHFLVLWRRVGSLIQVMDPGLGRRWVRASRLEDDLYLHRHQVAASDYLDWFLGEESQAVQRARLAALAIDRDRAEALLATATSWQACARLDGAVRMATALWRAGALRRAAAARLVGSLVGDQSIAIPDAYMAAAPVDDGEPDEIEIRGAVLVRVLGRLTEAAADGGEASRASASVMAAGPEQRPRQDLWRLLRSEPRAVLLALAALVLVSSGAVVLESLVLRGLIHAVDELGGGVVRAGAAIATLTLLVAMLLLDVSLKHIVAGLGRRLEVRLRLAFLERLPRLKDRYFRTRLTSDLAHRAHAVHRVRNLPEQLTGLARAWIELALLSAALAYLAPAHAWVCAAAALAGVALALAAQPWLRELDLRARTHRGLLGRFFLDALLGAAPIRAHRAEPAVGREHEALQCHFLGAERRFIAAHVAVETAIFGLTLAPLALVVVLELQSRPVDGSALLLVYWAFLIPHRAALAAQLLAQYPAARNTVLRLTEPLVSAAAPEPDPVMDGAERPAEPRAAAGPSLTFEGVSVAAGGHVILREIDLAIPGGAHVAVVGPSGAGKSTLLGLLLGWLEPAAGRVLVDDHPLDASRLERLRRETAWVDPAVQLWNRSLFENLIYGADSDQAARVSDAVERAELRDVLEGLPAGLQTDLGEGGRLLSGGQGQRVRLGRALVRDDARLALLDEPFRGLDHEARIRLLSSTRRAFAGATLLFVTHDISHALDLDLVLVIEDGRIVEHDDPASLAARTGSRFAAMLAAEKEIRARLWSDSGWRRIRLDGGGAREDAGA